MLQLNTNNSEKLQNNNGRASDIRQAGLSLLVVIGFIAASLLTSIGLAGSASRDMDRFPPGTTVNGLNIAGMSYEEGLDYIVAQHREQLDNYTVLLDYYGYPITLNTQELGIINCIQELLYNALYTDGGAATPGNVRQQGQAMDLSPLFDAVRLQTTLQDALSDRFTFNGITVEDPDAFTVPILNADYVVDDRGTVTVNLNVNEQTFNGYVAVLLESELALSADDTIKHIDTKEMLQYRDLIEKYSKEFGLDPAYVAAVVFVESGFNPEAKSQTGAVGLMQIQPSTGLWISGKIGLEKYSPDILLDPAMNLYMGCWYLSYLRDLFGGNMQTATTAYNAGPVRVMGWLDDERYSSDGVSLHTIPFEETQIRNDKMQDYHKIFITIYKMNT